MPDAGPSPATKLHYLKEWHLWVLCARRGRVSAKPVSDLGAEDRALWEVLLKQA